MDIMEIVLLVAGGIVFILSFLIPVKKGESSEEARGLAKEEIKALVSEELEAVRGHVDDVVEEAVTYSIEKTERSLERLSNEKIMAVNEYSDTVLAEIHKNHEEVMFLYDMLNDKHINLKNTVSEINRTMQEARETKKEAEEVVNTFQRLAPETMIPMRVGSQPMVLPQAFVPAPVSVAVSEYAAIQEPAALVMPAAVREAAVAQEQSVITEMPVLPPEQSVTTEQESGELVSSVVLPEHAVSQESDTMPSTPVQQPYTVQQFLPELARESELPLFPGANDIPQEMDGQGRNYNDRIMELYKSGKSKVAIARELNLGVGEVKLVIDLYKNRSEK